MYMKIKMRPCSAKSHARIKSIFKFDPLSTTLYNFFFFLYNSVRILKRTQAQ